MSIPNVPSLSKLIQHGSEGGLEFARIINMLLIEYAQINDFYFQPYSDASGDFKGVDAILEKGYKKIGLQYKFFSGNPKDKVRLEKSLLNAVEKFPDMDEWILVTPDDFTRHGISWIEELSNKVGLRVKHWGHTTILNLMLKFQQIGKMYHPDQLFKKYNLKQKINPTKAEAHEYFSQFADPEIDTRALFFEAQPMLKDFKYVFKEDIYKEISEGFNMLYRDVFDTDRSLDVERKGGPVRFEISTIEDMKSKTAKLPGGMYSIFEKYNCFNTNCIFYTLRVGGMYYSVWCYIDGRWIFFPKPWRIVESVYSLKENKEVARLIRWLRWLGFQKALKKENSKRTKLLVNRIVNALSG